MISCGGWVDLLDCSPTGRSGDGLPTYGVPLLSQFARNFPKNYLGDTFEAVVAAGRAGYRVVEIPAGLKPRTFGVSTASRAHATKFTIKGLGIALMQIHMRLDPCSTSD